MKTSCDGNCEPIGGHKGTIKRVVVMGRGKNWGEFNYCDVAIETDRSRNFNVEIVGYYASDENV